MIMDFGAKFALNLFIEFVILRFINFFKMNENEIKALISLLDDEDYEIQNHVVDKIKSLGGPVIPYLEKVWESSGLASPILQKRIEDLIHELQYQSVIDRLVVWNGGGAIDLLEGLWIVASYQYPEISLEKLRAEIEQIFYEVWIEFKPNMHPTDQVKILNSVIFDKLKFGPNTKNFHSASNSMINIVLESHKGNPISLCTIYMLVAQKLGLPIFGVNLPNLFVLTYKSELVQFYINVFNRGLVFYKADIDNYIGQLNLKPSDIFYEPCSNLNIMKRVLRNLALSYEKTSDTEKLKEIETMMRAISDSPRESF
jgi:regulator of sirC expression with transglutaminase-like and TPR domain